MADWHGSVYDRMNHLAKEVAKITDASRPERSPSTKKLVADELKGPMCELMVLYELTGRIC